MDSDGLFITADLQDVRKVQLDDRFILVGRIYNDALGRWPDGEPIHTSYVDSEIASDIFVTRSNNTYRVTSWQHRDRDPGDETASV